MTSYRIDIGSSAGTVSQEFEAGSDDEAVHEFERQLRINKHAEAPQSVTLSRLDLDPTILPDPPRRMGEAPVPARRAVAIRSFARTT